MGWRILRWLWRSPPAPPLSAFVLCGREATVFMPAPNDTLELTMSEQFTPEVGAAHDLHDEASRNIGIGGILRKVGGTYASAEITLSDDLDYTQTPPVAINPDSLLLISAIAFDPTTQRVSFRLTEGTRGVKYLLQLRLFLTDGRHYDFSFWQRVRDK
jgi:hypothetical protein